MIGLIECLFFSLGLVHAHIFLSFLLLLALVDTDKSELENFLIYVLQLGFLKYVSANVQCSLSFVCLHASSNLIALRNPDQSELPLLQRASSFLTT